MVVTTLVLSIISAISSGPLLMPISAKIMLTRPSMSALEGSELSELKLPNRITSYTVGKIILSSFRICIEVGSENQYLGPPLAI